MIKMRTIMRLDPTKVIENDLDQIKIFLRLGAREETLREKILQVHYLIQQWLKS